MEKETGGGHLDDSKTRQPGLLLAGPFSIFNLVVLVLLLLLEATLLPLLTQADGIHAKCCDIRKDNGHDALRTLGYLLFAGEEAPKSCVAGKSSPGMASVPALNGDCCLVHLLNKPSQRGKKMSHRTIKGTIRQCKAMGPTSLPPPLSPPSFEARQGCRTGLIRAIGC